MLEEMFAVKTMLSVTTALYAHFCSFCLFMKFYLLYIAKLIFKINFHTFCFLIRVRWQHASSTFSLLR